MATLRINTSFIFIGLLALYAGCQDEGTDPQANNPSPSSKLIGPTWKIKTVTVDGVDYTSSYTGMTIKFSETTYSTSNGGIVWPASGTWKFNAPDNSKIKRNDDIEVTVSVTDAQLDLSLDWSETTYAGGRSSSVKGNHRFTFLK